MRQSTNRPRVTEPRIWFRIIHVAEDGPHRAPGDAVREQTVEITLGSKGAFKGGNVGAVTRRVEADQVVCALPEPRGAPKPPRDPRTPRVVGLLRKAMEWQRLIESGEAVNRAEIARRDRISRARVTQVMALLHLAPEIQRSILSMPDMVRRPAITERALRPIAQLEDLDDQRLRFRDLISRQNGPCRRRGRCGSRVETARRA